MGGSRNILIRKIEFSTCMLNNFMNLRRQVDTLRCGNRVVLVSAPFFYSVVCTCLLICISTFLNILLIIKME